MELLASAGLEGQDRVEFPGPALLEVPARHLFRITFQGTPIPAGSKSAFPVRFMGPDGKWKVKIVYDKKGNQSCPVTVSEGNAKRKKKRREEVQSQAREVADAAGFVMPDKDVPLVIALTFFRERNVSDFGTGKNAGVLKGRAPGFPAVTPDATKLLRSIEDDLTGVLWHDDSRIVDQLVRKRFGRERVEFDLWAYPQRVEELPEGWE